MVQLVQTFQKTPRAFPRRAPYSDGNETTIIRSLTLFHVCCCLHQSSLCIEDSMVNWTLRLTTKQILQQPPLPKSNSMSYGRCLILLFRIFIFIHLCLPCICNPLCHLGMPSC